MVKVHWTNRKSWSQARLCDATKNVGLLLRDSYGEKVKDLSPRSFSLEWTLKLARGKGRSTAPVLEGIAEGAESFYKDVVEGLRPYVPRAPQLSEEKPKDKPESETDELREDEKDALGPTPAVINAGKPQHAETPPDEIDKEIS